MEQEHLNTGEYAFDPAADDLKVAMEKVESNFNQLFEVAENLNDQVSPPVILKITKTLPCRPDKGGLYLIDRKQKGPWKAYIERYNLNFGRVNRKNRPVGDDDLSITGTENIEYWFMDQALFNDSSINILTGIITVEEGKELHFIVNSKRNTSISVFVTNIADEGDWYSEHQGIATSVFDWDKSSQYTTLPTGINTCRVLIASSDDNCSISSVIVRQEFDIPEEKITGDKRYVLTKWTGTEWIFPRVPDGAEIPIKGKTSYFKSGQIVTPAVDFPRLVKAKIGALHHPVTQQTTEYIYLIFDRPLEVAEFSTIFSRFRGMQIGTPTDGNKGFQKGKTWRRFTDKYFGTAVDNYEAFSSYLRGFRVIGNNDFQKRFYGVTPITDYRVVRIPLAEFKHAFFMVDTHDNNTYLKPLNASIARLLRKFKVVGLQPYYYELGFELVKKVNGKRVFGPFYKLRCTIQDVNMLGVSVRK